MKEKIIQLGNAIWWDRSYDDKVDMNELRIVLSELQFAARQVCLRFAAGPDLDLSYLDMDRIAVEYLMMRGVELPPEVGNLANAKCPPRCDFLVPKDLVPTFHRNYLPSHLDEKRCARCLQIQEYSGDWYGDLCPQCADETDPDD